MSELTKHAAEGNEGYCSCGAFMQIAPTGSRVCVVSLYDALTMLNQQFADATERAEAVERDNDHERLMNASLFEELEAAQAENARLLAFVSSAQMAIMAMSPPVEYIETYVLPLLSAALAAAAPQAHSEPDCTCPSHASMHAPQCPARQRMAEV